jgi:hypothetical protein
LETLTHVITAAAIHQNRSGQNLGNAATEHIRHREEGTKPTNTLYHTLK